MNFHTNYLKRKIMNKYPRTYHFPYSPGAKNDDRIAQDISNVIGNNIVITEKLDGENNSMVSGGVYARSHATFTTSPWSSKVRQLHSILSSSISDGLYLFGEGMSAIHSIEYEKLTSHFYLFGARYESTWASWSEVEDFAFLLDIPTVPILFKGKVNSEKELQELVEELSMQESELGGIREGVVCRIANEFEDDDFSNSVFKWVRKDHVQTTEHWTKNWKWANVKNY